jgi:hypothetical protein
VATFDETDLWLRMKLGPEVDRQLFTIRRRAVLSKWLQACVSPCVEVALRENPSASVT